MPVSVFSWFLWRMVLVLAGVAGLYLFWGTAFSEADVLSVPVLRMSAVSKYELIMLACFLFVSWRFFRFCERHHMESFDRWVRYLTVCGSFTVAYVFARAFDIVWQQKSGTAFFSNYFYFDELVQLLFVLVVWLYKPREIVYEYFDRAVANEAVVRPSPAAASQPDVSDKVPSEPEVKRGADANEGNETPWWEGLLKLVVIVLAIFFVNKCYGEDFEFGSPEHLEYSCQQVVTIYDEQARVRQLASFTTSLEDAIHGGYCIGVLTAFIQDTQGCYNNELTWFDIADAIASAEVAPIWIVEQREQLRSANCYDD